MKIQKKIQVIATLLIILVSSCGIHREQNKTFSFVQITDPQFGFFSNNNGFKEEVLLYEKAVTKINMLNPAFVVITGDLVNDRSNKSQWDEFRRITSLIKPEIKVYLTPGNHDVGQNPEKKDIDYYKSMFGNDRFSFEFDNCRFIGFNSCLVKAETPGLEEEQFEWLEKELAAASGARQIMLFCHYPFFLKDPMEPENYSNIKPESRQKYLSLFSRYGVDALLSGHLHNNASVTFDKTEMITTSAVGKPLAGVPSGLRIIKVSGEVYKHQYFPLDSVRVLK
jgi:3',5'-cyclic AMP phosphodiesterase CpdA